MRCEIAEKKLKASEKKKRNVIVEVRGEVIKKSANGPC